MKVLHLSSFDTSGGAARAAYRIHSGLRTIKIDSQMLVQHQSSSDKSISTVETKVKAKLRTTLDSLLLKFHPPAHYLFSPQWFPDAIAAKIAQINPDIINLNWVCNSFLQIETLADLRKPLVWTLQDMWAFTGGCHYSLGCDRYQVACGACPQLENQRDRDLSRWVWQRKAKAWKDLDLTIVTPSQWMAQCAKASSLFQNLRVEVIPFGLDTAVFAPLKTEVAREILGLPQHKQLVLFGAIDATADTRKGFHLLQAALNQLSELENWRDRIELVVFGASAPEQPVELGFQTHYLGRLQDDLSLRVVYAAADVMVAPSIEEAFGQTASESIACGTPAVVFKNTGLADIVDHQHSGYVAEAGNTKDLANGIAWVLTNQASHQQLRTAAREKAMREFSLEIQAKRYLELFHEILNS